jgi:hypothetical protein
MKMPDLKDSAMKIFSLDIHLSVILGLQASKYLPRSTSKRTNGARTAGLASHFGFLSLTTSLFETGASSGFAAMWVDAISCDILLARSHG